MDGGGREPTPSPPTRASQHAAATTARACAVTVTIAWIALLAASVVVELVSRRYPPRVATIGQTGARIATRLLGRVILWIGWIFVGVHLFARYTIPR
jgi:hypothetical protein